MKTVKEVSEITGISIRTLRYYDEIGLLKPTELTEAGYRLYDNKALEKLQEIMFFRELERRTLTNRCKSLEAWRNTRNIYHPDLQMNRPWRI